MVELEYWVIDKDGKECQLCDTMSWAEAQKIFFQRIKPTGGPYIIRAALKIEKPRQVDHPKKTWSKR